MKRINVNFLIDILLLLLLLILLEQRSTGNFIHEWLGITVILIIFAHILLHLNWIRCLIRRFRLDGNGIKLILNILLFVVLATIMFSGLMISREVLPGISGHPINHYFWRSLHDISANLLLVLTGLHLAMNWNRILGCFRKEVNARKLTPAEYQQGTLQHHPPINTSTLFETPVKKNKQVKASLILTLFLVLFSAGISTGWYYFSQNNGAIPPKEAVRINDHGSLPARFNRPATRIHHARQGNNHQPGHPDHVACLGMIHGIVHNMSILFLLVFLTVMVREHFRSPKQIRKR